ncbi:MAG: TIGR03032 family protein, partial [Desulfobacteraceae bacterium]|nr:TIGR03032 family protein [Desulfobacteraceae bacterium]
CLRKAVQIKPDYTEALFSLLQHSKETCTWHDFDTLSERAEQILKQELASGIKPSILVFNHLAHWDDPESNLAIAKAWAKAESAKCKVQSAKSRLERGRGVLPLERGQGCVTIGYVSGDFRNHPVGHLISAVFGKHDRSRFKVIAYSFGRDDGSIYRKRVERDCDQFTDISTLSDQAAAERIRQDGVDILIDLMGQTRGSRMEIFALCPAPLQLTWLGYPGTSGAGFFDFLIADPIVIPQDSTRFYSEKLAYMPHTYLITDNTQPISAKPIQRADVGLPEHAFVFCSFNRPYKIDPKLFDVWMSVLKQFRTACCG